MIKAVIFDMDGVLIDSEPVYLGYYKKYLKSKGFIVDNKALSTIVGTSDSHTWKVFSQWMDNIKSLEDLKSEFNEFVKQYTLNYKDILNKGAIETISYYKENGYKVGLASSSSMRNIRQVLTECKMHELFDSIVSGEMFKESKPNPEIYLYSAYKLGVEPKKCIAIEDSTVGILAAHRAGMKVIGIKDERFYLDQSLADFLVDDLQSTIKYVNYLNK